MQHQWKLGEWHKPEKFVRYFLRVDNCELCGCERRLVRAKRKFRTLEFVVCYERSRIIYGEKEMPDCWGAKNPQ